MKEVLVSYGWVHYHTCSPSCGRKEYFNHKDKPGRVIITRPKKNTFEVHLNGTTVKTGYNYQLKDYLITI